MRTPDEILREAERIALDFKLVSDHHAIRVSEMSTEMGRLIIELRQVQSQQALEVDHP